jgi:uncharacterized protein YukJ
LPLQHYGVLTGSAVDLRREDGLFTPHVQVKVLAGSTAFRVAINVLSSGHPSNLLFQVDEHFRHPITSALSRLPVGFTALSSRAGDLALDYVRGGLVNRSRMRPLPPSIPGPNNDLSDAVERLIDRARNEPAAQLYAFGERWGPEVGKRDQVFGFRPGNGLHGIHMNQGNVPEFRRDDGVWQDGAVIIHFPERDQWAAIFLAFQSQSWRTDEATGHKVLASEPRP